jgi:hypothetical protein
MTKRLTLKRETIAELTAADLTTVVGGAQSGELFTCPVLQCIEDLSLPRCGDITANTCA